MTSIRITEPGGIIPRLSARRLPDNGAQVAANVSVLPGEWRPLRKPRLAWQPSFGVDPLLSVYRMDDTTWFGWPTANVRVEHAPLEGDPRYIITGDGVPKITIKSLATPVSAAGKPAGVRALGIPTPTDVPGVSASLGVGAAVTRFYLCTFVSDWNEEGSESPVSLMVTGKVDDTWAITNLPVSPPNSGTITGAAYSSGAVTVTFAANHLNRVGDEITIAAVLGMTDLIGVRTITAVPAANQVTVALTTGQTYSSGGTWARTAPWAPCTKRLYRTSGSTGNFQLVAEGITGTTYSDTLTDVQIPGDSLVSTGWVPPPAGLTGVTTMPGGNLVGFIGGGRTLCWCEPFQPHAWPEAYQRKVPDDIVGIAAFEGSVAVATKGMPAVYTGIDPTAMSPTQFQKPFPCLARCSVCSVSDGAVFATKNGLARMDVSGVQVFTEGLFMPDQWNALQPANMTCAYDGTRLFISTPVETRLFALNLIDGGALVTAYQRLNSTYTDPRSGSLYFTLNMKVYEFDAFDNSPMSMDWLSRVFVSPKPFNLGAAKVEIDADFYAIAVAALAAEAVAVRASNAVIMASTGGGRGGLAMRAMNVIEINGSILDPLPESTPSVSFSLYADGKVVYSKVIPNDKGFKLPSGYRSDRMAVRIQGNTQVAAVVLAETMTGLSQV